MAPSQNQGWIKLWRQIEDSAVFADAYLLKLFILCLLKATHTEVWWPVHGLAEPIHLGPGQFITGRFALHSDFYRRKKKTNASPSTVWRWLQTLENMGNLNIQTNSRFSLVTVCQWERYQQRPADNEQPNEQPVNSRRTAGEQPMHTNKKEENVQKEEITTPPSAAPTPPYALIRTTWNQMAEANSLPLVRGMTEKRKAAVRGRWRSNGWQEDWQSALALIPGRSFLLGENDRGWQANLDWFLKPNSVTSILEGMYRGKQGDEPHTDADHEGDW